VDDYCGDENLDLDDDVENLALEDIWMMIIVMMGILLWIMCG
jgi:hypothetical protein